MEAEYNERMPIREILIKVGDKVLIKLKKQPKDTPVRDIEPYTVIEVNGSLVTASRPNHVTTRNLSFFKRYRQVDFEEKELKIVSDPSNIASEKREETEIPSVVAIALIRPLSPPTKKAKIGRPNREEAERRKMEYEEAEARRRAANPSIRTSKLLHD